MPVVGLHDSNALPAGKSGRAIGPAQAGVSAIDMTIRGIGGHGAMPQAGCDPVPTLDAGARSMTAVATSPVQ